MNPLFKMFFFFFDLLLPLCVGYAIARKAPWKEKFSDRLMTAAILLVAPPLCLLSCWAIKLEAGLLWLPVLGIVMQVVPGALGFLRARAKSHDTLEKGSYVLAAALANRGTMGALTAFVLFGEVAYGHSRLIMLLAPPVVYGVCFPMARYFHLSHHGGEGESPSWLSVLLDRNQVPVLGVAVGFALSLGGVPRPAALGTVFQVLVHVLAWTVLLPIGAALDFGEMRRYWRDVLDLLPIKFVLTPVLVYALCRLVSLEGEVLAVTVILAAAPTAINSVMIARLQRLNVHVAMAAFVLTTAVYLFVMLPLILAFVLVFGVD